MRLERKTVVLLSAARAAAEDDYLGLIDYIDLSFGFANSVVHGVFSGTSLLAIFPPAFPAALDAPAIIVVDIKPPSTLPAFYCSQSIDRSPVQGR